MKAKLMIMLAEMMVSRLDPEQVKAWADMGLDLLENQIEKSENTYDDMLATPVIKAVREAFSIPDNDVIEDLTDL